jgi:integrin alpha FG-GAP repeat containing protein 1
MRLSSSVTLAVLTLVYEVTGASAALWPFREKRFKAEKMIDAGPLGLEGIQGRVIALGDWDGDQQ